VAEVDGELAAALNPDSGLAIDDPFRPTADTVALLRMHARENERRSRRAVLPGHLGPVLLGRA
jgi:hypothetical protein